MSTCSPAAADVIFSDDESEVVDSFFQDSICQKDRANRSVATATNVRVSVLALGVGGWILTVYMGRLSRRPSQLL